MNTDEPKFVYFLSFDGTKDDIELYTAASSIDSLKHLLTTSYRNYDGDLIIKDSIIIRNGFMHFNYKTYTGGIESGQYGFLKIPLVSYNEY